MSFGSAISGAVTVENDFKAAFADMSALLEYATGGAAAASLSAVLGTNADLSAFTGVFTQTLVSVGIPTAGGMWLANMLVGDQQTTPGSTAERAVLAGLLGIVALMALGGIPTTVDSATAMLAATMSVGAYVGYTVA